MTEREKLLEAIKETEYKYFGDYALSSVQCAAVDTLVQFAQSSQPEIDALKAENEKLRKDAGRLDFLDTNKRFNMRWQVGIAPVGCISVRSIINGKLSIREAIDAAMTPDTKGE